MSQDGDIEENVVVSTNVAKVREVIARPRKVGSGVPGALRGRRELVLAPRVLQHALPDVATLLKDSMPSALGPCKNTAHELAQATKKRVIGENEDKRQNAVQPDSALKPHEAAQPQHECPVCRQMCEDMFDLTSHARTHNGPARSYLRARKAPKSPAVFNDTGHQTQMNRKQTQDTFTLKPNGHSGKQVPDVSELASTADSHSGHKNESPMEDIVIVKDDTEDRCIDKGVSPEAARMGLYKDHQIKDELVLGPVLLQPRDVAFIVQNNNEKEPTSTVDSPTANDEESVSQDSVTVKVEPEERCFDEGVTEAIGVDYLDYQIKDELLRDERCFEEFVSTEAAEIGLYKDHQIKDELVLGPVLLQPRDVAFIVQNNNEKEPTSTIDSATANGEEAVSQDSVTVKVEPEERCFDERITEAIGVDHWEQPLKRNNCEDATSIVMLLCPLRMTHTGDKPDKHGDVNQDRNGQLTDHNRTHTGMKPFECRYCDYATYKHSTLQRHEKEHTSYKPFKCSYCNYTTRYKSSVTIHELQHSDASNKRFRCSHCDYTSHYKAHVTRHELQHSDASNKRFRCSHCDYTSHYKSNVTRHELTHNKPFKCSHCDYTSHHKSAVARHQLKHSSEKSFKCSYCNYTTRYKGHVSQHELIHTEKPFKCSYCNYTARYKSSLTKHELKHSFKRFKCSHCDYTTRYKAHVTRHKLRHHSHKKKN